jgi:hypothetical protein
MPPCGTAIAGTGTSVRYFPAGFATGFGSGAGRGGL